MVPTKGRGGKMDSEVAFFPGRKEHTQREQIRQ